MLGKGKVTFRRQHKAFNEILAATSDYPTKNSRALDYIFSSHRRTVVRPSATICANLIVSRLRSDRSILFISSSINTSAQKRAQYRRGNVSSLAPSNLLYGNKSCGFGDAVPVRPPFPRQPSCSKERTPLTLLSSSFPPFGDI